jgi:predicted aconitase
MFLTKEEERMFSGEYGPGVEKAIRLLVKFGEAFNAERLVKVTSAHTLPIEPYDFLLEITEAAKPRVFTTTHALMSAFDPLSWREMGIPEEFAEEEVKLFERRLEIYRKMGFLQTFTCLPFLVGNFLKKGDIVSLIGSGVQIFANSIIGARTTRGGTTSVLASAITGRTPYMGLLRSENRCGEISVELDNLDLRNFTNEDFGALGYYIGGIAGDRNVVIKGMPKSPSLEQCKSLLTPLPVSGAVGLCHIVGVTPEAETLDQAFGGGEPEERFTVGKEEVESVWESVGTADGGRVDLVVLGCPHCTITEIAKIASLLERRKINEGVRLWIGTAEQIYTLAKRMGYAETIEKAGGVFSRSCMAGIPDVHFPEGVTVVATNSIKSAHYLQRLTKGKIGVLYGTLGDCINAAISGEWMRGK